jgi:hypothetical protein
MDSDLDSMSREELIAEARKLRAGIREHRDSTGHDLCWHHPKLVGLLPEKNGPGAIGARLASVPRGLRQVSAVARQAAAGRAAHDRPLQRILVYKG